MSDAPPLQDGEEIVFDHIPSLRSFKRTALLMIGLTLPAVIAMVIVFPDTFWPAVPLFITCFILMQERFRLGRYRAWVTTQRIILQGGREYPLADVLAARASGNGVRVNVGSGIKGIKLFYPDDGDVLVSAILHAQEAS